jgi:hypothetical protein
MAVKYALLLKRGWRVKRYTVLRAACKAIHEIDNLHGRRQQEQLSA